MISFRGILKIFFGYLVIVTAAAETVDVCMDRGVSSCNFAGRHAHLMAHCLPWIGGADPENLGSPDAGAAACLTHNGLPVVFQFDNYGTDLLGPRTSTSAEWVEIPGALPRSLCYARQEFNAGYHHPLPGCYTWWNPDPAAVAQYQEKVSKAVADGRLAFHVGMVAPK